jgi:hypothetical protein
MKTSKVVLLLSVVLSVMFLCGQSRANNYTPTTAPVNVLKPIETGVAYPNLNVELGLYELSLQATCYQVLTSVYNATVAADACPGVVDQASFDGIVGPYLPYPTNGYSTQQYK